MVVHSMTGYGESTCILDAWVVEVTIQALNSKNLDISINNAPQAWAKQLTFWRKRIVQKLVRGRVDVTITCKAKSMPLPLPIGEENIQQCYRYLDTLAQKLGAEKTDVLSLTLNLLSNNHKEVTLHKKHTAFINAAFEKALEECIQTRASEGKHLVAQIQQRLTDIKNHLKTIMAHIPIRKEYLRRRLEDKIKTREGIIDANRWEQEVLYYLEKMDIEEECVRLQSHIKYSCATFAQGSPIGSRLVFIVQEMLREINTISAKAQDTTIQHIAVAIKQAIEQIREQGRNLL